MSQIRNLEHPDPVLRGVRFHLRYRVRLKGGAHSRNLLFSELNLKATDQMAVGTSSGSVRSSFISNAGDEAWYEAGTFLTPSKSK
jgi:hypothetical protein